MSFLAPGFLIAGGVAALVVVGLHFLSTREPKLEMLPTTRFLPDLPVRATATTLRPTDPWLLLLRVLFVLLIGAALARPVLTLRREPVARIVAVDVSRAVGDRAELADSAERYLDGAAAVILFDSAAYEAGNGAAGARRASDWLRALAGAEGEGGTVGRGSPDSIPGASTDGGVPPRIENPAAGGAAPWLERPASRGSLSASFVAARRAAARIRDRADSLELVVISPFVTEEYDAATDRIRRLWPGRVTTVAVVAAGADQRRDSIRIEWADSVAIAAAEPPTDAAEPFGEDAAFSPYWTAREPPDTSAAVRAGDAVLVHPLARHWDLAVTDDADTRVIARWVDGEPAGIEHLLSRADGVAALGASATGCVRSFGFSLPVEGDALLRPEFQRFLANLRAPCGEPRGMSPLSASVMASLEGDGPLAATTAIDRRVERVTPFTPWLLLAAALLAVLELLLRRGRRREPLTSATRSAGAESTARAA